MLSPAIYLNPRQQKRPSNVYLTVTHPPHLAVYQFKSIKEEENVLFFVTILFDSPETPAE